MRKSGLILSLGMSIKRDEDNQATEDDTLAILNSLEIL